MHHQKNQLRRDALNNPRIYQAILETVGDGMASCIGVRQAQCHLYGRRLGCLTRAAASNGQVANCTTYAREVPTIPGLFRNPTDEWIRGVAVRSEPGQILDCLAGTVCRQLEQSREMKLIKEGQKLDMAIDMHLIPRYDKKHGKELVHSKKKNGTHVFERYITMQCIVAHCRLVLPVLYMPALEDTADFVRKIIDSAHLAGTEPAVVMLDREFFSASVI